MRANGWQGVTRRKKVRTTIADPAAARAADLVKRQFRVPAPQRAARGGFHLMRESGWFRHARREPAGGVTEISPIRAQSGW